MATLKIFEVADPRFGGSNMSLRQWLDGRWAVLFSHPDDFVQSDLEFDRWLGLVGEAFARARIRPLALPRGSYPNDRGWISRLTDGAPISLHDRLYRRDTIDLHACRLRDEIAGARKRFAMIIDGTLSPRSMHTYGVVERPPSPLDFVRQACRLRDEQARDRLPREPRAVGDHVIGDCVAARVATPRHVTHSDYATA